MAITLDGTTGITTPAETNSGNLYVTGNVGIGTASPISGRSLTVSGQTNAILALVSSGVNRLDFGTVANYDYGRIQYDTSDNSMRLFTSQYEQLRLTSAGLLQFNSGYGSVATAYGCRAWVNFNGQGTVAIRSSGNVSSITDNGTGAYTINFITNMPDANYAVAGTCMNNIGTNYGGILTIADNLIYNNNFKIFTSPIATTLFDPTNVCVSVFR